MGSAWGLGPRPQPPQAARCQGRKINPHHGNRQHLGESWPGGRGIEHHIPSPGRLSPAEAQQGGEDSRCQEAGERGRRAQGRRGSAAQAPT